MARIAIMLPRFSRYGGVEQFGYRLAGALAARGHSVDFICARQEAEAPPGVTVRSVGRPPLGRALKLLWFLAGAERQRRKGGYDLSISLGKTWNQDISRMGGGPLSVFWKQSERALPEGRARLAKQWRRRLSPYNWITLLVEKRQFSRRGEVIAVSHLVRDWLVQAHPALSPDQVQVVYNRPDPGRFPWPGPEARQKAHAGLAALLPEGLRGRPLRHVGSASTNFELKGVGPLIRALSLLPDDVVLFIAGGRASGAYSALARDLGLEERVIFLGKVEDMAAFYQGLDLFILPTFYDACSNAVLEALASGCRAITSGSNGAAFFLEPEAVLEDPGDVPAMAGRLERHLNLPLPQSFTWPENAPSGLEAFVERIEDRLGRTLG